ncbi:MAG: DUF1987 domain-containing protein [Cyclobacteriaceae bacterium]
MFNFTTTTTGAPAPLPVTAPTQTMTATRTTTLEQVGLNAPATEKYVKEATRNTPYVYFDQSNGILRIVGKSSPESSLGFYEPILDRLSAMTNEITVDFELVYFNTSSTKCIFSMLKILEGLYKKGAKVSVKWAYEEDDDDMLEVGEDFQDMVDLPLTLEEM